MLLLSQSWRALRCGLNRPVDGEVDSAASRLVYEPARVTAVLEDNAAPDYENAEGRRVGDQELEIEILSGTHRVKS